MIDDPSLFAATLLCAWTLLLLGAIAIMRSGLTLLRIKPANSFAIFGEDVSPFSGRLCRAHANCYENLPAALGVLFVAQFLDLGSITDGLALWLVAGRLAQSATHLISTTPRAVRIRFLFFLVQYVILAIWIVQLLASQIS
uniref:MAPEG family protein n=1 Tax=uncultured Altererythrobacter sp. TaxID=500840 RepID=UPI0026191CFD|nr:MAPEG family protein [uncultured Altererythrobacter sp.]